ncbi:hypothetical protein JCM30394_05710 [Deferrisoma palaeochoriense]
MADLADRIDALVARGETSPDQAELYWLYAVRAPERLPAGLRTAPAGNRAARAAAEASEQEPFALRCGTPVLRHVRARLGRLPPALRAEAVELLGRPAAGRGAAFRTAAGKTGAPALANPHVTEHFSIEWGPDLTNEDGSTPLRDDGPLGPGDPATGGNGIPDVVERWAAYFEAAYAAEVGEMGYTHPAVEANLIPVYIGNSDATTSLEDIGSRTYAFTWSDEGIPYIVVNNDLSFVPPNGEGTSGLAKIHGAMKITAAHELFHVFHFLYEPQGVWNATEDDWWFECSSTWMEDEVFDDVNDYYQYFNQTGGRSGWADFLESGLPVDRGVGDLEWVTRAYGSVIFAKYLSEHVGGRQAMFDVWDRIRFDGQRILDALDAFATANGFAGLPDLFLGFVGATAIMDYEEGANYGSVPLAGTSLESLNFFGLGYLGARYEKETLAAGVSTFAYDTPTESGWGVATAYRDPLNGRFVYGRSLAAAGRVEVTLDLPRSAEVYVAAARLTSGEVPAEPPAADGGGGGGGGGGGCFLSILGF